MSSIDNGCAEKDQAFWAKVERTEGCWLWRGEITSDGRGRYRIGGRRVYAHRYAWSLSHGDVDQRMVIGPSCGTDACVRPDHLEAVLRSELVVTEKRGPSSSASAATGDLAARLERLEQKLDDKLVQHEARVMKGLGQLFGNQKKLFEPIVKMSRDLASLLNREDATTAFEAVLAELNEVAAVVRDYPGCRAGQERRFEADEARLQTVERSCASSSEEIDQLGQLVLALNTLTTNAQRGSSQLQRVLESVIRDQDALLGAARETNLKLSTAAIRTMACVDQLASAIRRAPGLGPRDEGAAPVPQLPATTPS